MICKQCGNEFPDGKNFCPKCGTKAENENMGNVDEDVNGEISSTVNAISSTVKNDNVISKKIIDFYKNNKVVVISVTSIVAVALIVLFVNIFSNQVPNESKIKTDLMGKTFLMDNAKEQYKIKDGEIKKLEITKRKTNKKDKIDDVFVKVQLSDGKINMDGDLELNYVYNDKGGWILKDKIQNLTDGGFKYTSVTGVDDDFVKKSLIGQSIKISDNDNWNIDDKDIKDFKITNHASQLNNNIDNVTIDLSLQSNTATASGKIMVIYKFDKKNWVLQQVKRENNDDFKYSFVNGLEPNFDEDKIKKDIIGKKIELENNQTYTIKQEDIKNFSIDSKIVNNKGENQTINSKFQITNSELDIKGIMHINYKYTKEKQWNLKDISSIDDLVITYTPVKVLEQRIYNDLKGMRIQISGSKAPWSITSNYTVALNQIVEWKINERKMLDSNTEEISVYVNYDTNPMFKFRAQGIIKSVYKVDFNDWKMTNYSFTQTGWFE